MIFKKHSPTLQIYVGVASRYRNKTEGMCGNLDGNKDNDMSTREGVKTSDPAQVGDSYLVPNENESDVSSQCLQAP